MKVQHQISKSRKVKLIYIGRRQDVFGNISSVFLYGKKELCYSSSFKRCVIGWIYCAERKNGRTLLSRRPEHAGEYLNESDIETWRAKDSSVEETLLKKRAEAKARKDKKIIEFAKSIKPIIKGLTSIEKRKYLEVILNHAEKLK